MKAAPLALILATAIIVLLYHDSRQNPVPPSFSYSRRGMEMVASADQDKNALQKAVETLYEALRLDPKDPVALFAMAWAIQLKGAAAESNEYYLRTVAETEELQKYSYYNLSFIREKEGDSPAALAAIENALKIDPTFALAQSRRVQLLGTVNNSPGQKE